MYYVRLTKWLGFAIYLLWKCLSERYKKPQLQIITLYQCIMYIPPKSESGLPPIVYRSISLKMDLWGLHTTLQVPLTPGSKIPTFFWHSGNWRTRFVEGKGQSEEWGSVQSLGKQASWCQQKECALQGKCAKCMNCRNPDQSWSLGDTISGWRRKEVECVLCRV